MGLLSQVILVLCTNGHMVNLGEVHDKNIALLLVMISFHLFHVQQTKSTWNVKNLGFYLGFHMSLTWIVQRLQLIWILYPRGCISPIFHYIFIIPSLSHQSYSKKHYSKNLGHLFVSSKKNYKGLVSTYPVGWGCKKSWGSVNQRLWHRSNCDLATKTPGTFHSNLMWIEK